MPTAPAERQRVLRARWNPWREPKDDSNTGITKLVVPTHVGVNREHTLAELTALRCPHARGGEPDQVEHWGMGLHVVPTHVGMNRLNPAVVFVLSFVLPTTSIAANKEHVPFVVEG